MSRMTYEKFEAALDVAVADSDDQALADLSAQVHVNSFEQTKVLVALGDTWGPAGAAALRTVFDAALAKFPTVSKGTRSVCRDLLCTWVFALAKREDRAATDVYVTAATHDNPGVREYGAAALAAVGDGRAWGGDRGLAPHRAGTQGPAD